MALLGVLGHELLHDFVDVLGGDDLGVLVDGLLHVLVFEGLLKQRLLRGAALAVAAAGVREEGLIRGLEGRGGLLLLLLEQALAVVIVRVVVVRRVEVEAQEFVLALDDL